MKADRELLDLAALAAGLVYEHPGFAYPTRFKARVATWHPVTSGCDKFEHIPLAVWNPLADDSDALRLAVKLGLVVCVMNEIKTTGIYLPAERIGGKFDETEHHGNDPYAATRRAIVRAAARLGSAMLAAAPHPQQPKEPS